jgi:hypothetical protein
MQRQGTFQCYQILLILSSWFLAAAAAFFFLLLSGRCKRNLPGFPL